LFATQFHAVVDLELKQRCWQKLYNCNIRRGK